MKPANNEYPAHFEPYIRLVPAGDVVDLLEVHAGSLAALLTGTSEADSLHTYARGKWSVRQVVAHVSDIERVFAIRAFWFARSLPAEQPGIDEQRAMAAARADERNLAEHLREFSTVRSATLSLFQGLPAAAWTRSGIAAGHNCSVRALAHLIVGHQLHHERLLQERYGI